MKLDIQALPVYLRAELSGRTSAAQGREAGEAIFAAQSQCGLHKLLIIVRGSDPIFRVEQYNLSDMLQRAARIAGPSAGSCLRRARQPAVSGFSEQEYGETGSPQNRRS